MGTQKDKLQKGTTGQPKDWQASTRRFRVLGGFFSSVIFIYFPPGAGFRALRVSGRQVDKDFIFAREMTDKPFASGSPVDG